MKSRDIEVGTPAVAWNPLTLQWPQQLSCTLGALYPHRRQLCAGLYWKSGSPTAGASVYSLFSCFLGFARGFAAPAEPDELASGRLPTISVAAGGAKALTLATPKPFLLRPPAQACQAF